MDDPSAAPRPSLLRQYIVPAAPSPGFQWHISVHDSFALLQDPPAFATSTSEKASGPKFHLVSASGQAVHSMQRTALAAALGPLLGLEPEAILAETIRAMGDLDVPSFLKTLLRVVTVAHDSGAVGGVDPGWFRPPDAGADILDGAAPGASGSGAAAVQVAILRDAGFPIPPALTAAAASPQPALPELLAQAAVLRAAGAVVPAALAAAIVAAASAAARVSGSYAGWDPLGRDGTSIVALRALWNADLADTVSEIATATAAVPVLREWDPAAVDRILVSIATLGAAADLIRADLSALPGMSAAGRVGVHRGYRPAPPATPPELPACPPGSASASPSDPPARAAQARATPRRLPDPVAALTQQRQLQVLRNRDAEAQDLAARIRQLELRPAAPPQQPAAPVTPPSAAAPAPSGISIEADGFSTMSSFIARNPVDAKQSALIRQREYVSLPSLLSSAPSKRAAISLSAAGTLEFDATAGDAAEAAKANSLSMRQAREALRIWALEYGRHHPEEASGALAYVEVVFPALEKRYGHVPAGIFEYDQTFRRGAAAMAAVAATLPLRDRPMPRWDAVDVELERSIFANTFRATCHCGARDHYPHQHEQVAKTAGARSKPGAAKAPGSGKPACFAWNGRDGPSGQAGCSSKDCGYAHVCSKCGSRDHPALKCKRL